MHSLLVLPPLFLALAVSAATPPAELYSPLIAQKVLKTAQNLTNPATYPEYTDRTAGNWINFGPNTWTTGFFPTTLYALNTRATLCNTSDGQSWLDLGRQWNLGEIPLEHNNTLEHDVGFVSMPFIEEYKLDSNNETAKTAIVAFAQDLADRFSPIVGCTRSWDNNANPTDFEVIIDNMMNLEVLFVAEEITGNHTFIDIATSHADKTMVNHVRADGSSFHLVNYNSTTGAVISQVTAQGYANNSTWSRGQAWGIYGFANMYLRTQNISYLETSRRMATYFLDNIPSDGIVPWDFNAPLTPPRPADSSAATVAATALILLGNQELSIGNNQSGANYWQDAAIQVLSNMSTLAWRPEWESLLSNGTVNNRANPPNNLTGIVYGDYYWIKAGNDLISANKTSCSAVTPGSASASSSGSAATATSAATNSKKRFGMLRKAHFN